jgi:tetratricopeptide (TPR) repeat protein
LIFFALRIQALERSACNRTESQPSALSTDFQVVVTLQAMNCVSGSLLRSLVPLAFWAGNALHAQAPDFCLTQGQLQEIQQRSMDDTRMFLSHIGWYFQGENNHHGWVHDGEVLSYHQSAWTNSGGRLELFHYPGQSNVVVYHTDAGCNEKIQLRLAQLSGTQVQAGEQNLRQANLLWRFSADIYSGYTHQITIANVSALNKEVASMRQREAAEKAAEAAAEQAYRDKVRQAERFKASGQYTKAIAHYQEAVGMRDDGSLWESIRYCERMICLYREVRADSAYRAGNYALALDLYRDAIGCSTGKENIQTKIRLMERTIREQQLAEKKKEADRRYQEKRYAGALAVYNEMLQIDPANSHARERVREIRLLLDFLERRSNTVFRYSKMQQRAWSDWKTGLLNQLEVRSSQSESGSCEARLYVRFDTSGRSIGNTQITSCTDQTLRTYLNAYSRSATLLPAKDNGYFVSAEDELRFRLDWKTTPYTISVDGNRDLTVAEPGTQSRIMSDFLRNRKAGPGNYQFTAREKTLNGKPYTDISLFSFDNRKTAEGMWRTLLLPGAGARWLSYGTKGKRSSKRFLFLSGIAVGSLLYANAAYDQAQQATNPVDAANLEEEARIAQGLAWFSGSISCCIYGGEILRTLKLGRQNKKHDQSWNTSLKLQPLIIQSQHIAWP